MITISEGIYNLTEEAAEVQDYVEVRVEVEDANTGDMVILCVCGAGDFKADLFLPLPDALHIAEQLKRAAKKVKN